MWFRNIICRNEAYMRVILEPLLQITSIKMHKSKYEGLSVIHYFIYSFIGTASMLVYFLFNPYNIVALILCIFLFIAVVFLDCHYYFGSTALYNNLTAEWETIKDSKQNNS